MKTKKKKNRREQERSPLSSWCSFRLLLLLSLASTFDQVTCFSPLSALYIHTPHRHAQGQTVMYMQTHAISSSHANPRQLYMPHFSSYSCHHPRPKARDTQAIFPLTHATTPGGRRHRQTRRSHEQVAICSGLKRLKSKPCTNSEWKSQRQVSGGMACGEVEGRWGELMGGGCKERWSLLNA